MSGGFFTRADAKGGNGKAAYKLPVEYLHKLGERGAKDMNPGARTPNMPPSGAKRPLLYVLGEAPGADEDQQGIQFVGASGRKLRGLIPPALKDHVRWNNCVRTRPPGNRTPTPVEIECFRPSVVEDIERSKPKALLAVGGVPLSWVMPKLGGGIKLARGRRFLAQVGAHACWMYPILHPAFILRVENAKREDDVPGEEWKRLFAADLARVWQELPELPNAAHPEPLLQGVRTLGPDELRALPKLLAAMEGRTLALDFETNTLRPYSKDARAISCALSDGRQTLAWPLAHRHAGLGAPQQQRAADALLGALGKAKRVYAHNLPFELEWLAVALGGRELLRGARWGDTMLQGYALDERLGGLSLDYLCHQHLGVSLKEASNLDRARLEQYPLEQLLRYNALDAKYTLLLARIQQQLLKQQGLSDVYAQRVRTAATVVLAQIAGLPVDQRARGRFQRQFEKRIEDIEHQIRQRPEVKRFNKRYASKHGEFNWASNPQLTLMFRDVLKRNEGRQRNGKYSTKHAVLESMKDEPLAKLLLDLREATKLKGTYVDALDPTSSNSVVYPDGKLHTSFKLAATVTGRFSSEGPNVQNFPKRHNAQVRSMVAAPSGWSLLSCDYGQIEARVIGMASRDKAFCHALWHNLDVHKEWAEHAMRLFPPLLKRRKGEFKKLRADIKNQLVFPAFYGAGVPKICALLGMPEHLGARLLGEFWETFTGVSAWQRAQLKLYKERGYVECLTGRRRRAPLSTNMIYNAPIQGTASDIVVDAMNRLSEQAQQQQRPYLQAVLNVHDDLTFLIPNSELERAIPDIVRAMVQINQPWVNVPIQIEVAAGPNWYELEDLGQYDSQTIAAAG